MNLITFAAAIAILQAGGRATRKDFFTYWSQGYELWEIVIDQAGTGFVIVNEAGTVITPIRVLDPENPPQWWEISGAIWHTADSLDFVEIVSASGHGASTQGGGGPDPVKPK